MKILEVIGLCLLWYALGIGTMAVIVKGEVEKANDTLEDAICKMQDAIELLEDAKTRQEGIEEAERRLASAFKH